MTTTRTTPPPFEPPYEPGEGGDPDQRGQGSLPISDRPTTILPPLPAVPRVTQTPLGEAETTAHIEARAAASGILGQMGAPIPPTVPLGSPTLAGSRMEGAPLDWSELGTLQMTPPAALVERIQQMRRWIEEHLRRAWECRELARTLDAEIQGLRARQAETRRRWEWARGWVNLPQREVMRLDTTGRRALAEARAVIDGETDTLLWLDRELATRRQGWVEHIERAKEFERAAYALRLAAERETRTWS